MIPARHLLQRHLTRDRGPRDTVILDLGEDVSSVWSSTTGTVAQPSRVAVDDRGHVHGFGLDADLLAADPRNRLVAMSPFGSGSWDSSIVRAFLVWLMGGRVPCEGLPVFLPLPPDSARAGDVVLRPVVAELGGDALVIHRPLAAAVALGLDADEPSCHLMVEVTESRLEIAVIREGSVVLSRRMRRGDDETTRHVTRESLRSLDPDDELEILDRGAHLYGWAAPRYAADTVAAIDLPLAAPVGVGPTVLNGARLMAVEVLPWLIAAR